ncbi:MAG: hypothetical protein ACYCQJ_02685 [Nitrososphaerales archaeon]
MTFCDLNQVKDELVLAYTVTSNDAELNNLLSLVDTYINTRLQKLTSLPLQTELSSQLADYEARLVVARFRLRRATPQEQQQYQAALDQIELELQEFLKANFRTTFSWASPSVP